MKFSYSICALPLLAFLMLVLGLRFGIAEEITDLEETEMEPTQLMTKLRQKLELRDSSSSQAFGRVFLRMDDDGSKGLSEREFTKGVSDSDMKLSAEAMDALFKDVDTDNNDSVSISEFLRALRPVMNDVRVATVKNAFRELDKNEDEMLTIEDLKDDYVVKNHPKFQNGEETEQEILNKFLSNFEKDKNGKVTEDEFVSYFTGISASIDDDAYFESMVRQAYNIFNNSPL